LPYGVKNQQFSPYPWHLKKIHIFTKKYAMSSKDSTVRVKPYTKELILKHSRKQKISQSELIERAILCAEQHNFSTEITVKQIEKNQQKEANRIIGFLKMQDKNLNQMEENIFHYFQSKLKADRNEVLEFVEYTINEELPKIARDFYSNRNDAEDLADNFVKRFKSFYRELYPILRRNILKLGDR
jgi:hypothetical protein